MIDLAISRLPITMACGASAREEIKIGSSGPPAKVGNSVHALLHGAVKIYLNQPSEGLHLPGNAVEIIEEENPGADPKEAFILASYGLHFLRQIVAEGAEILGVEMEVSWEHGDYRVIGHLDLLLKLASGEMAVVDYKTGDPDGSSDHLDQLRGYLLAVLDEGQGGRYFVAWLKNQTTDTNPVSWDSLCRWKDKLFLQLQRNTFSPGDHCFFCPVKFSCPAQEQMNRSTASSLLPMAQEEGAQLPSSPEFLASLWTRSRQVKKALEEYENRIAFSLRDQPEIPLPDGRFLRMEHQEWEDIVFSRNAVETVGKLMGRDIPGLLEDYPQAFKVSRKIFMDSIAAGSARGEKKGAIEAAMKILRDAGVLETVRREFPKAYKTKEVE